MTLPDENTTTARGQGAWHAFLRILGFARPHWRRIVLAILLMVVYAGASSLRVGMVGLLFDGVIVPGDPAAGPGKVVAFYRDYVEPIIPLPLELHAEYRSNYHVLGVRVISGELVTPWHEQGGDWCAEFLDGRMEAASIDADHDGNADGELEASFTRLKLRLAERPAGAGGMPATPVACGRGVVSMSTGAAGSAEAIFRVLLGFAAAGAVLALIIAFSNFGREYLSRSVFVHCVADLRGALFQKISRLSVSYFHGRRAGDLLSRLTNDVNSIQLSLRYLFEDLVQQPITIVAALGAAFFASWQLTLVVLPFLPLLLLPMVKSGPKVKKHGRGSLVKLGEITHVMTELLSGIRVVKAFNMEEAQAREFAEKNHGFVRSSLKMLRAKVMASSVLEGIYNLLAAMLLAFGAWLLVGQWLAIGLGDFATFLTAIALTYQPLKVVTKAYNTVQESLAGAERVFEVLDERPSIQDRAGAQPFSPLAREIAFEKLSFRYASDDRFVLRDIDFRVARGQTVALVGPSGAGKSTLLDLLARFHDPEVGRIALDGRDLRDGTHASLLAQIAIVGQEPFLFHTTIEDNIRFGRPHATRAEIEAAAKAAAIHDEIAALPEGYATVLGDRGQTMSGGQRQRLTIARAILKNAEILILDEATSSLDTESERKVQAAINNLLRGKTTFVIAHRLSTIQHADRILVIVGGRIVDSGTHDELKRRGGLYAHLLEMQQQPAPEAHTARSAGGDDLCACGSGRPFLSCCGAGSDALA